MSSFSGVTVSLPFEDLPDTAEVSGTAKRYVNGRSQLDEGRYETVLQFRRRKVSELKQELSLIEGSPATEIILDDIRFA